MYMLYVYVYMYIILLFISLGIKMIVGKILYFIFFTFDFLFYISYGRILTMDLALQIEKSQKK